MARTVLEDRTTKPVGKPAAVASARNLRNVAIGVVVISAGVVGVWALQRGGSGDGGVSPESTTSPAAAKPAVARPGVRTMSDQPTK